MNIRTPQPPLSQQPSKAGAVLIPGVPTLGFGVEPGPGAWFAIMRGLGDAVAECLGRP